MAKASNSAVPGTVETNVFMAQVNSSLDCPVCLNMFCEPISLTCGHTFCRVCLFHSLRRIKKKCPSCRAICELQPESAQENVCIREICKSLNPTLYAERSVEAAQEKQEWSELLPIFFYNEALFPGNSLSLHLFEPRYKVLARRAAETTRKFAYCANFVNYQAQIGDVILVANLEECEFMPDGRCMLQARLTTRQEITDTFVEDGSHNLHYAKVKPVTDAPMDPAVISTESIRVAEAATKWASCDEQSRERIEAKHGPMPSTSGSSLEAVSLWLSAVSLQTGGEKLASLKTTDTKARLDRALPRFETLMQTLAPRARDGARGGGRRGGGGGRGGRGRGGGGGGRGGGGRGGAVGFDELLFGLLAGAFPGAAGGGGGGGNMETFEQHMMNHILGQFHVAPAPPPAHADADADDSEDDGPPPLMELSAAGTGAAAAAGTGAAAGGAAAGGAGAGRRGRSGQGTARDRGHQGSSGGRSSAQHSAGPPRSRARTSEPQQQQPPRQQRQQRTRQPPSPTEGADSDTMPPLLHEDSD